ncbi:S8 family serine peptidase [Actinophytocola xinjiangensis]|uniref:S8 family serine peptidase n=1 Tax=Actinophytocola xinjiangensis TaxID=485602 RepID=UPI000A019D5E|nr:S8 family serine peptidase [Actinophytocola xinjiangensis]
MRFRRWTVSAGAVAVLAAVLPATPATAQETEQRDVPVAPAVASTLADEARTDFWVVFDEAADLAGADEITDWAERGRHVYDTLVRTARDSQRDLVADLTERGADVEPFWIANRVLVRDGDRPTLDAVLAQDGVAEIQADEPVALPVPVRATERADVRAGAVEWGIDNIRADRVWSELGVRGEGVVVGNIDSGVQFTHPALVAQYRGNRGDGTFDHDYQWWDPSQVCAAAEPCDNSGHGTHTMGTMVGADGADNRIGVAPGARWIAAKGCEGQTCSLNALLSAGQFMLAPTDLAGQNPRPELRPHVVNNSWGGAGGSDFYDAMVNAWSAAGMFPVFSNGNEGPACGSAGSPGDASSSYGVGAYDSANTIARFSSRGPGRDNEIKPNLSAPGVAVRSAVPGDGYESYNGTSMAAPHVAGTVALLWSAAEDLVGELPATRAALDATAIDTEDLSCGGTPENNNVYGQGRLDALGATLRVAGTAGIGGQVTDAASGTPVADAQVRVLDGDVPVAIGSGADGRYRINLLPGTYDVEVTRFGFERLTLSDVVVRDAAIAEVDAGLTRLPTGTITGRVTLDKGGLGVPGATIKAGTVPLTTTGADGTFLVAAPVGTYEVSAAHEMFPGEAPSTVVVERDGSVTEDFVLRCGEKCELQHLWTTRYDGTAGASDVPSDMVLSPDGDTMYVTGESPGAGTGVDMVTIAYDTATGARQWETRHDGSANGADKGNVIGVSADGETLYVAGSTTLAGTTKSAYALVAYDAGTGAQRWTASYDGPGTDEDSALGLAISPDGSAVYVTGYSDDVWRDYATIAYRATTGDRLWVARYDGPGALTDTAMAVRVAPDGATVHVTGYSRPASGVSNDFDYATISYRADTGEQLWVARYSGPRAGGSDSAQDLRVSPDSSTVVVTGHSPGANGIDYATVAYDRDTGEELWVARYDGPGRGADYAFGLDLAPDGSTVYVTGRSEGVVDDDYATIAYDTATGEQRWLRRYDGPAAGSDIANAVAVSPDGSAVFVTGHSTGVGTDNDIGTVAYAAADGAELWQARYNGPRDSFDSGRALQVSEDSARVYVTGFSFGVGTNRDYATIGYEAKAQVRRPVFVPWGLRVRPDLATTTDRVTVRANVTNVGTAPGDHDATLTVDGKVLDTTTVTLAPARTTQVDWTTRLDQPGHHRLAVGQASTPLRVVRCDRTVTGTHPGGLTVTTGVTCLSPDAIVHGGVTVGPGAGLVTSGAVVNGRLTAVDASVVLLRDTRLAGRITVTGADGLVLSGNRIAGDVTLRDNITGDSTFVVSGNSIAGTLSCAGNAPVPSDQDERNEVAGRTTGQCASLRR